LQLVTTAVRVRWRDRVHFFAIATALMRRILVEYGRARQDLKRGAGARKVSLDQLPAMPPPNLSDLIAIADAWEALAALDARKSRVVELRFFGGLSVDATAEAPDVLRRPAAGNQEPRGTTAAAARRAFVGRGCALHGCGNE